MLLAIDIGNTNIVFALCEGTAIRAQWRIRTDIHRTADEYAVWLFALMAVGIASSDITDAILFRGAGCEFYREKLCSPLPPLRAAAD